jgi:hypothetical protein
MFFVVTPFLLNSPPDFFRYDMIRGEVQETLAPSDFIDPGTIYSPSAAFS